MKIGNYTDDEILEFMTEGEGRGFLGRSMFDAMYFEIERLNNIIDEAIEYIKENEYSFIDKHGNSQDITQFLEILKGSDKE